MSNNNTACFLVPNSCEVPIDKTFSCSVNTESDVVILHVGHEWQSDIPV